MTSIRNSDMIPLISNQQSNAGVFPIIISPYYYVGFVYTSLLGRMPKVEEFYTRIQNYYPKIREIDI